MAPADPDRNGELSGVALLPLDEAVAFVLDQMRELPSTVVPIADAAGAVLSNDVVAREPVPPFDNSALDGFAVKAADVAAATGSNPVPMRVLETVLAGSVPTAKVGVGSAIRIMTGAPMPEGADAVVMVENTRPVSAPPGDDGEHGGDGKDAVEGKHVRPKWNGGVRSSPKPGGASADVGKGPPVGSSSALLAESDEVEVLASSPAGAGVRKKGSDLAGGAVAVAARTPLRAAHIGVLANVGVAEVPVVRRPTVGVLSTGDELVEPGLPLGPGQIRDSNRPGLVALLREDGFDVVDLGCVPDDHDAIRIAIGDGVERCDAVISSGGVSMGDVDLVRVVLDEIGHMRWMKLAIKPAKPFAFGTVHRVEGTGAVPVFGVPGNPVSSIVSYELLARPALRKMAGFAELHRPRVVAVADVDFVRRRDGKVHFPRVACSYGDDGRYHVGPSGGQDSHQLAAMAAANGLAVLADGEGVRAGDGVEVLILR